MQNIQQINLFSDQIAAVRNLRIPLKTLNSNVDLCAGQVAKNVFSSPEMTAQDKIKISTSLSSHDDSCDLVLQKRYSKIQTGIPEANQRSFTAAIQELQMSTDCLIDSESFIHAIINLPPKEREGFVRDVTVLLRGITGLDHQLKLIAILFKTSKENRKIITETALQLFKHNPSPIMRILIIKKLVEVLKGLCFSEDFCSMASPKFEYNLEAIDLLKQHSIMLIDIPKKEQCIFALTATKYLTELDRDQSIEIIANTEYEDRENFIKNIGFLLENIVNPGDRLPLITALSRIPPENQMAFSQQAIDLVEGVDQESERTKIILAFSKIPKEDQSHIAYSALSLFKHNPNTVERLLIMEKITYFLNLLKKEKKDRFIIDYERMSGFKLTHSLFTEYDINAINLLKQNSRTLIGIPKIEQYTFASILKPHLMNDHIVDKTEFISIIINYSQENLNDFIKNSGLLLKNIVDPDNRLALIIVLKDIQKEHQEAFCQQAIKLVEGLCQESERTKIILEFAKIREENQKVIAEAARQLFKYYPNAIERSLMLNLLIEFSDSTKLEGSSDLSLLEYDSIAITLLKEHSRLLIGIPKTEQYLFAFAIRQFCITDRTLDQRYWINISHRKQEREAFVEKAAILIENVTDQNKRFSIIYSLIQIKKSSRDVFVEKIKIIKQIIKNYSKPQYELTVTSIIENFAEILYSKDFSTEEEKEISNYITESVRLHHLNNENPQPDNFILNLLNCINIHSQFPQDQSHSKEERINFYIQTMNLLGESTTFYFQPESEHITNFDTGETYSTHSMMSCLIASLMRIQSPQRQILCPLISEMLFLFSFEDFENIQSTLQKIILIKWISTEEASFCENLIELYWAYRTKFENCFSYVGHLKPDTEELPKFILNYFNTHVKPKLRLSFQNSFTNLSELKIYLSDIDNSIKKEALFFLLTLLRAEQGVDVDMKNFEEEAIPLMNYFEPSKQYEILKALRFFPSDLLEKVFPLIGAFTNQDDSLSFIKMILEENQEIRERMYSYLEMLLPDKLYLKTVQDMFLTIKEFPDSFPELTDSINETIIEISPLLESYRNPPEDPDLLKMTILSNPFFVYDKLLQMPDDYSRVDTSINEILIKKNTSNIIKIERIVFLNENKTIKSKLPTNIHENTLNLIYTAAKTRLASLPVDDQEATEDAILQITSIGFENIQSSFTDSAYLRARIKLIQDLKPEDVVPRDAVQLTAIIAYLSDLPTELSPGAVLSEQEEALIKLSEFIRECPAGKSSGITLAYNQLPSEYRYEKQQAHLAEVENIYAFIEDFIQKEIINLISGETSLMRELTNVPLTPLDSPPINQLSHQSLYYLNSLGRYLGIKDELQFDLYTGLVYPHLLEKELLDLVRIFLNHFTPELLIKKLEAYKFSGKDLTLSTPIYELLEKTSKTPLDVVWISHNDDFTSCSLTTEASLLLLIATGILTSAELASAAASSASSAPYQSGELEQKSLY